MKELSEDKFNVINTSCKELASFINKLINDQEIIEAIKAIPNAEAYAQMQSLTIEELVSMMACQDVIQCITSLFGFADMNHKGASGLFCAITAISNNETSHDLYFYVCTINSELCDKIQSLIDSIKDSGVNATTDQFKVAILLSKVNDDLLYEYWELMYNFAYANLYAEDEASSNQIEYLENLISNAKENLDGYDINYSKPWYVPKELSTANHPTAKIEDERYLKGVKKIAENGGHYKVGLIDYRLSNDGNIEAYANRTEIVEAITTRMWESKDVMQLEAANTYHFQERLNLNWSLVNEANAIRNGDCAVAIHGFIPGGNKMLNASIHPYTIKSSFFGYIKSPEIDAHKMDLERDLLIEDDTRLFVLTPDYEGILGYAGDYTERVNSELYRVKFISNAYSDTFFYDINVMDKQPKKPISLFWHVHTGDTIRENQDICTIKTPFKSYDVKSKADGIIAIDKQDAIPNDEGYGYGIGDYDDFYTLYNSKEAMVKRRFYNCVEVEDDEFDGAKVIKWEPMAGRYFGDYYDDPCDAFEVDSNNKKKLFISFKLNDGKPVIELGIGKDNIISKGDVVSLMFEDESAENKKTLNFTLENAYNYNNNPIISRAFCCKIFQDDLDIMSKYNFTQWRIKSSNNGSRMISGINESSWTPRFIASLVFKNVVKDYIEWLNLSDIEIPKLHNVESSSQKKFDENETCWVYLMHDTTNNFYKIGMSNNPEYRESTLQSEKPTIELVTAKEYPNRIIAAAIESALHKAFDGKRIRGEWFNLSDEDVIVMKNTLN